MAFGNRFRFGGNKPLFQSGFLSENDAARFARAAFFDLFKRSFWDCFGCIAFDREIYEISGVEFDCFAHSGFSRKFVYGVERRTFSRVQFVSIISASAVTIGVDCVGVLVYKEIMKSEKWKMNRYTQSLDF